MKVRVTFVLQFFGLYYRWFKTQFSRFPYDRCFIAERQLYVPSMFFSLYVADFLEKHTVHIKSKCAYCLSLAAIFAIFISLTINAAAIYKNDFTLYTKLCKDNPDLGIVHKYNGEQYYANGKFDDAIVELNAAFSNEDQWESAMKKYSIAKGNIFPGNVQDGVKDFDVLRRYDPVFAGIHFFMGLVYFEKGDTDSAIKKFKVVTVLEPNFLEAHAYLGRSFLQKQLMEAAKREYSLVLAGNTRIP